MRTKEDTWVNYDSDVEETFIPLERDMWIIYSNKDGSYIWASRCVGVFKIVSSPYLGTKNKTIDEESERVYEWQFAVIDSQLPEGPVHASMFGDIVGVTFEKPSVGNVKLEEEIDLSADSELKEKLIAKDVLRRIEE
jgi:hypothetical protein